MNTVDSDIVSIISPCYNVEPYICRYLDSLLLQTYKYLEIILIDDGSTDSTGKIIRSYIPKLEQEGYKVIYHVQENSGQSNAINRALKLVTGKYLTWPDPDDWLTPDSIEKRVTFMEKHPDVGMVRSNVERIDFESGKSLGLFEKDLKAAFPIENAFEKLVFVKTWYAPIAYMVRMSYFDKVVTDREIYVSKRGGQNWQIMLPIAQRYPSWQIPEVLGYYTMRRDSHSHSHFNFFDKIQYSTTSEEVLTHTLIRIKAPCEIIKNVRIKYANERFFLAAKLSTYKNKRKYFSIALNLTKTITEKLRLCIIFILPYIIWHCIVVLMELISKPKASRFISNKHN